MPYSATISMTHSAASQLLTRSLLAPPGGVNVLCFQFHRSRSCFGSEVGAKILKGCGRTHVIPLARHSCFISSGVSPYCGAVPVLCAATAPSLYLSRIPVRSAQVPLPINADRPAPPSDEQAPGSSILALLLP